MKTGAILAAAAGIISSASAANGDYINVLASRSASPIHLRPINAHGGHLWIGKKTESYCPDSVNDCPPGTSTNYGYGDGSLSMGTEVPGGQQVYIERNTGAVRFTVAHSAATSDGAILNGWSLKEPKKNTAGTLSWRRGLLACPTKGENGPYKVFANVKGVKFDDDCLGFQGAVTNSSEPAAWEYI